VSEGRTGVIGTTATFTKQVSEADIALFSLVTRDEAVEAGEPPAPVRQPRQAAPYPLLAALLAAAAARHAPSALPARFARQDVRFSQPIYTDDTLSAVAEVAEYDEGSRTLHIRAACENQDGLRLAEGDFYLLTD
jgi:acyl dehydratase